MVKREVDPARWSRSRVFAILLALLMVAAAPASAQVGAQRRRRGQGRHRRRAARRDGHHHQHEQRRSCRRSSTGPEGNYRAVNLQPAPYEIAAELSGFATVKRSVHAAGRHRCDRRPQAGRGGADREHHGAPARARSSRSTKSQPSSVIVGEQLRRCRCSTATSSCSRS